MAGRKLSTNFATVLLVALAMAIPSVAFAYDLSGAWFVSATGPSPLPPPQHYLVVQNSETLDFAIENYASSWTRTGTIDEDTGAFVQDQPQAACGGPDSLTGFVAADGNSFTATYAVHFFIPGGTPTLNRCELKTYTFTGSRCGNRALDPDEDCDDGNRNDADCCSSTCSIESDGTVCSNSSGCGTGTCSSAACVVTANEAASTPCDQQTSPCSIGSCDGAGNCNYAREADPCAIGDGNVCTDDACDSGVCASVPNTGPCEDDDNDCTTDVCDGAGACGHLPDPGSCTDDCGSGTCSGTTCVISNPSSEGNACDLDDTACTPDTCDGAGTCVAAAPLDCSPCGLCDAEKGCVADLGICETETDSVSLILKTDPDGGDGERLRLRLKDEVDPADLGDPTATTDYTLCLYQIDNSGVRRTIASMLIPAGGTCSGSDCWSGGSRFIYKDKTMSTDGIRSIRLDSKGIAIAGAQSNLPLPPALIADRSVTTKVTASDGTSTKCWSSLVPADSQRSDGNRFKGTYRPF
jgi:hypothetical protein